MTDYYNINANFSEDQKLIQSSIRAWVDKSIKPEIGRFYQRGEPFPNLASQLAESIVVAPRCPRILVTWSGIRQAHGTYATRSRIHMARDSHVL